MPPRSKRQFQIFINAAKSDQPAHYLVAGGPYARLAAYDFENAIRVYCAAGDGTLGDWRPPTPGEQYEYAVQDLESKSVRLFTVKGQVGYEINPT